MRIRVAYFASNNPSDNEKLLHLLIKEINLKRFPNANIICVKSYFNGVFPLFIYLKKYASTLQNEGNIFMKL